MPSAMHFVFVYGTLKRGHPNFHYLTDTSNCRTSRFITEGKTVHKYPLVIASKYNIPFLLDKKNTGYNVNGEVFQVNDPMFEILDELEAHPNFYVRRMEPISMTEEGKEVVKHCWTYFFPKFKDCLLQLPHLEDYRPPEEQKLKYVPSEDLETEEEIYQNWEK